MPAVCGIIPHMSDTQKTRAFYISAAALALLFVRFALWCISSGCSVLSMAYAGVIAALLGLALIRLIPAALCFDYLREPQPLPPSRETSEARLHPYSALLLRALLLRLALCFAAYCFDLMQNGYSGGLVSTLGLLLSGQPLPPVPAALLSALLSAASAIAAYELLSLDTDRCSALLGATLLCALPESSLLLCSLPAGLLLACLLLSANFLRRKKYPLGGLLALGAVGSAIWYSGGLSGLASGYSSFLSVAASNMERLLPCFRTAGGWLAPLVSDIACPAISLLVLVLASDKLRPTYSALGLLLFILLPGFPSFPVAFGLCLLIKGRQQRLLLLLLSLSALLINIWLLL